MKVESRVKKIVGWVREIVENEKFIPLSEVSERTGVKGSAILDLLPLIKNVVAVGENEIFLIHTGFLKMCIEGSMEEFDLGYKPDKRKIEEECYIPKSFINTLQPEIRRRKIVECPKGSSPVWDSSGFLCIDKEKVVSLLKRNGGVLSLKNYMSEFCVEDTARIISTHPETPLVFSIWHTIITPDGIRGILSALIEGKAELLPEGVKLETKKEKQLFEKTAQKIKKTANAYKKEKKEEYLKKIEEALIGFLRVAIGGGIHAFLKGEKLSIVETVRKIKEIVAEALGGEE